MHPKVSHIREKWEPLALPDADWPDGESPAVRLLNVRYRAAGLMDWDNKRVATLCRQIKCTPYELCAAAGLFHARSVRDKWKTGRWPAYLTLHFHKLEQMIHRLKFMDEPESGPGLEDIEMAKLIALGKSTKDLVTGLGAGRIK